MPDETDPTIATVKCSGCDATATADEPFPALPDGTDNRCPDCANADGWTTCDRCDAWTDDAATVEGRGRVGSGLVAVSV